MREEQKNVYNEKKARKIELLHVKVGIIIWSALWISVGLLITLYYSAGTYYTMQEDIAQGKKSYVEINKSYDSQDIESIEAVRKFFLFYYEAEEYNIVLSGLQTTMSDKAREAVNQAQILIGKYGEILLDEHKKLTFDKNSRDMKITNEAFELKLYFNVDVPLDMLSDYNIISIGNGSWKENNNDYVFYKFGKSIEGGLFPNVKEIKATDEFASFEDKDNNLFVYCRQHGCIIQAGATYGQDLYWTYDPEIYLPESFNDVLRKELFVEHKECNK